MTINITLKPSIIRDCCIEHNFYTCGDNEEYEAMFQQAIEENDLEKTAKDIVEHSEIESLFPLEYVEKCLIISHVKAWKFDI